MKLKKIKTAAFVVCVVYTLMLFIPQSIQDIPMRCFAVEVSGDYIFYTNEDSVTITKYLGKDEVVEIPQKINGLPVTNIGYQCFDGTNYYVTSIIIPDTVVEIGMHAFSGMTALKSVTIPSSVKIIGYGAFSACHRLEEVIFDGTVYELGGEAFQYDSPFYEKLLSDAKNNMVIWNDCLISYQYVDEDNIVVDDGIITIAMYAFSKRYKIKNVTLSDSVQSVCDSSFSDCYSLEKVTILNSDCTIRNIFHDDLVGADEYSGIICGYKNSTAQKFAEKYGYTFEAIDSSTTETTEYTQAIETTEHVEQTETTHAPIKTTETSETTTTTTTETKYVYVEPAEDMVWNGINPDITRDGKIDASDGAILLCYAAESGAGIVSSFKDFMDKYYS